MKYFAQNLLDAVTYQLPDEKITVTVGELEAFREFYRKKTLQARCHWATVDGEKYLIPGCEPAMYSPDPKHCQCENLYGKIDELETTITNMKTECTCEKDRP